MESTGIEELLQQQENDPETAQAVIAGEQPVMTVADDSMVKLPRGRHIGDRWDRDVMVRELTGRDEEVLTRYRQDPVLMLDAVVTLGVESIGPEHLTDKPFDQRAAVTRELLVGEREQLFLEVCRATFGDTKELNYSCGNCGADNTFDFSISQHVTYRKMGDPQRETYEFVTRKDDRIEYRLATGEDQFDINSRNTGLTDSEQNTILFSELIVKVNGRPPVDPRQYVLDLSMGDRGKLLAEIISHQPSPDMIMTTECPACGGEVLLPIAWDLIFRP